MTAQLVTDALIMAIWRRGKPDALLTRVQKSSWLKAVRWNVAKRRGLQRERRRQPKHSPSKMVTKFRLLAVKCPSRDDG